MTFHEFKNGMSVMDGRRCVASAKLTARGWIMTMRDGCWLNPLARTQGLMPGKYPHLMVLPGRREARRELKLLARVD